MSAAILFRIAAAIPLIAAGGATDTLELLRAAQRANVGRYPHGELRATLKWGQYANYSVHHYDETRLIWADGKMWADVLDWGSHKREFKHEEAVGSHEFWIVEPGKISYFVPHAQRLWITSPEKFRPECPVLLGPMESWYGRICGRGLSWLEMLGPTTVGKLDASEFSFSAIAKTDDRTEVTILSTEHKIKYRLVFSLAADGNAVEYELDDSFPDRTAKGSCEWKRDARGRLFLASRKEEQVFADPKATLYFDYHLVAFNPDLVPDARQFEIGSLKIQVGTMLRDDLTGRNHRIGDLPAPTVIESLGGLTERMQSRGFASGKRK